MKFRTLIILAPAMLLLTLSACKKEEETKSYMDGTLLLEHSMPSYVSPGDVYTFKASGVTAPDGTAVGYYFTDPITSFRDTTTIYVYTVPDSLGTFSLSCYAYPIESSSKYYVTTAYYNFAVVSSKTLTGVESYDNDGSALLRGCRYRTTKAGDREWIRSNLSYMETAEGGESFGYPYAGCSCMAEILGAYYTWEEAQTACPEGWHLPSEEEWVAMLKGCGAPEDLQPLHDSPVGAGKLMAGASFNGSNMWAYYRAVSITDDSHFSAIPAGYASVAGDEYVFSGILSYAAFWTSDEYEGQGVYRYIYQEYDKVSVDVADKKAFAASVRCVR